MASKTFGTTNHTPLAHQDARVAVVGAGSLGTAIGGLLLRGGVKVDLVDKNPHHVEAMKTDGLYLTGTVSEHIPNVSALYPSQMQGSYDIILLCTKIFDNRVTVPFLLPFLKDDGVIISLQDGFPDAYIASVAGSRRTMGCTVEWGATKIAPGRTEITSEPGFLSLHLGKMPGVSAAQMEKARDILGRGSIIHFEDNLRSARWGKMAVDCSFTALNAVLGGTYSSVSEGSGEVRAICLESMKECFDIGHHLGVTFQSIQGKDLVKSFYYRGPISKRLAIMRLPSLMRNHRHTRSSMLQDILRGQRCEVDDINGNIVTLGRENGIPTPVNERIVDILTREMEGRLSVSKDNIRLFR